MPAAADVGLIDALPYLALNLAKGPLLRTLFEVTQLSVQVDDDGDRATLKITLPEDQLPEITEAAERKTDEMSLHETPARRACEVAAGAPGEIRTLTGRVLNPLPLPVGLRGHDVVTLRDHPLRAAAGGRGVARATSW